MSKIQFKPDTAFIKNLTTNLPHFRKSQYNVKTIDGSITIDDFTLDDLANLDLIGRILGGFVDAKYIHELEDFKDMLKSLRNK